MAPGGGRGGGLFYHLTNPLRKSGVFRFFDPCKAIELVFDRISKESYQFTTDSTIICIPTYDNYPTGVSCIYNTADPFRPVSRCAYETKSKSMFFFPSSLRVRLDPATQLSPINILLVTKAMVLWLIYLAIIVDKRIVFTYFTYSMTVSPAQTQAPIITFINFHRAFVRHWFSGSGVKRG